MKKQKVGTVVRDCQFIAVKWDDKAIRSVEMVAEALLNLTRMFNAQNIKIDAMLKIEGKDK